LEGLPTIENLPDNINDASQLKDALVKIHGAVQLSGPDAPAMFATKVAEMRSATAKVIADIGSKQDQLKSHDDQLSKARKDLSQAKAAVRSNLSHALFGLAIPQGLLSGILAKNWLNSTNATN
jgi:hypothetical protein